MKNKIYQTRREPIRYRTFSKRKYHKQIQHWRRYKSGRATLVNKGIKYRMFSNVPHFEANNRAFTPEELSKLVSFPVHNIAKNTLSGSYFEDAEILHENIKSIFREDYMPKIAEGEMVIKTKNGKVLKLIFKSDKKVKGFIDQMYWKNPSGAFIKVPIGEAI